MNVLNAVPLATTASSKAIAFSLIMVMVLVPCSVVVGVTRAIEERGIVRDAVHIDRMDVIFNCWHERK
jgi:hypothetical protein